MSSLAGLLGGTLRPGWGCPPLPQANIGYIHKDEIGEIIQYPLEGLSETSNDQALLIPFNESIHEG